MIVLMADIIGSSSRKPQKLMDGFKEVVQGINSSYEKEIISPLTVTLGDEFQGVTKDAFSALRIIFSLENLIMCFKPNARFKLRYVIYEGKIETKINSASAYEMLGEGLTNARKELIGMKSSKYRFSIHVKDQLLSEKINLGMYVYQGIIDGWTPAQQTVVNEFINENDYKKVAQKLKKDPSVIWRRKKHLLIDEHFAIMKLILKTVNPKW